MNELRIYQNTPAESKRYYIQIEDEFATQAFYVLLRTGVFQALPGEVYALPGEVYYVSQKQLDMLRAQEIQFKFLDSTEQSTDRT